MQWWLSKTAQERPIKVDLFIDKDNVIRSQERIGLAILRIHTKHPILLLTQHLVVNLLIYDMHLRTKHSGTSDILLL